MVLPSLPNGSITPMSLRFHWTPIASVVPFTYRDGWTMLKLIEEFRKYITETFHPDLVRWVNEELDQIKANLDDLGAELETNQQAFINRVTALVSEINNRVGPTDVKHFTVKGATALPFSDLWPNNHVIWYEATLDGTGSLTLPSNITGDPLTDAVGNPVRFLAWPDGNGNFKLLNPERDIAELMGRAEFTEARLDKIDRLNELGGPSWQFSEARVWKDHGEQSRYTAWPHVASLGGSSYLMSVNQRLTHGNGEHPAKAAFTRTDDNGNSWYRVGEYQVTLPDGNKSDTGVNSLLRLRDGRIMAIFCVTRSGAEQTGRVDYFQVAVSSNEGNTWTVVKNNWVPTPLLPLLMSAIETNDAVLIPYANNGELGVYRSTDLVNWSKFTVPSTAVSQLSIEPKGWADGNDVALICRTTQGPMTYASSRDGGKTWSQAKYLPKLTQKNTNGTLFGSRDKLCLVIPNRQTMQLQTYDTTYERYIKGDIGEVRVVDKNYTQWQYDYGYLTAASNNGIDFLCAFYGGAPGRTNIWTIAASTRAEGVASVQAAPDYDVYTYTALSPWSGTCRVKIWDNGQAHLQYNVTGGPGLTDSPVTIFRLENRVSPAEWYNDVTVGEGSGDKAVAILTRSKANLDDIPELRFRRGYGDTATMTKFAGQFDYACWLNEY